MKKLFKERNLYFLIKKPYPENLYLKGFPIWNNKKLLPEFEKPLERTIKHLKKKLFKTVVFSQKIPPKKLARIQGSTYPLFTEGQAEIHVYSPKTLYRKISSFYKMLVEKKKYHILYGLWNQKKLLRELPQSGLFHWRFLEKKVDSIFFKTGMFQSLAEVQKEIHHGKLRWNGSLLLSKNIRGRSGDLFSIPAPKINRTWTKKDKTWEQKNKILQNYDPFVLKKLLCAPFFFQYKRILFALKKMKFYDYLLKYKKSLQSH